MNRIVRIALFLLSLLFVSQVHSSTVIELKDDQEEYELGARTIEIFEDKTMQMGIEQVSAPSARHKFHTNLKHGFRVNNPKANFWIKIRVKDYSSGHLSWLMEFYDNRIDDINVYIPQPDGSFKIYEAGDRYSFGKKNFQHINFVFPLNKIGQEQNTIYVRLHANHEIYVYGLIRSVQRYVDYTTHEYFYVSLFYGILLAMFVYNLLMYFSLRDRAYLYYVFYVTSIAFYSMSRDGFGYQFLWPDLPVINEYAEPIALYSMMLTILLYAKEFLHTRENNPLVDQLIIIVIILRTVILVIGMTFSLSIIRSLFLDMVPMLFVYGIGFICYFKGFVAARYYIIGFTALFMGYSIISLEAIGLNIDSALAFYAFNIGVVIQLVVLSVALADRVKLIIKEKNSAQSRLIEELTEKERMKSRINVQLEEMVHKRTEELENKNHQLDSFVYKASHDIKGPLRSLIGLSKVGMKDLEDSPQATVYFDHILKTATKLDEILADLLEVTKMKTSEIRKTKIDFRHMIKEIMNSFQHLNGYNRLKVKIDIQQDYDFFSDEKVLYSVLQNFIENGIKYQDHTKPESWLHITVNVNEASASIVFEDNGSGIDEKHLDKIFEMFYKVNDSSIGTGLGLYIVKQSLEKLGGDVQAKSKKGEFTIFTVNIPH